MLTENQDKTNNNLDFSSYLGFSIILLTFYSIPLLNKNWNFLENGSINFIFWVWIIFTCFWLGFFIFCLKVKRRQLGKIHSDNPFLLMALLYILTFDIALLMSYWIGFNNISSKIYSNIFSPLITIHATVLSIVIALTILSIQLNTDKYSFDMIEFFKNLIEICFIFIIFVIAIFLDILVLTDSTTYQGFCLIFGIFSILSLFPYIWMMLALMRPENLLQRYGNKISLFNLSIVKIIIQMMSLSKKQGEINIFSSGLAAIEKAIEDKKLDINILSPQDKEKFLDSEYWFQLDEIINLLKNIESKNNYSPFVKARIFWMRIYFLKIRIEYFSEINNKYEAHFSQIYR